jgi:hypothetical protein
MARYHLLQYVQYRNGTGDGGSTLTFYAAASGTDLCDLYDAAIGGSAVANPYTVPAGSWADFWVDAVTCPYVDAGDGIRVPVPLAALYEAPGVNVKDYGAVGNGIADDTAAIQAALDYVVAHPGRLYFPSGDYLVTGLTLDNVTVPLDIMGAGRDATRILTTSAAAIFSLGTYDSTPANPWQGAVARFTMSSLTLENEAEHAIANVTAGTQTSIGIQDNGCGNVTLRDVFFRGLKYGIYAPYGHDYCRYYDVDFLCCTTSIYFGPGSEQIYIWGGSSSLHDRAFVIEGAIQGAVHGFVFTEPKTRDIDILRPDVLESGITNIHAMAQVKAEMSWSFNDCWFETGSGWNTGWANTEHVRIGRSTDSAPNPVRGIRFRDVLLVSGSAGMGAKAGGTDYVFLNADNATYILIDGFIVEGDWIDAVVKTPPGTYRQITVKNADLVDGYTGIPAFVAQEIGNIEASDFYGAWDMAAVGPAAIEVAGDRSDGTALTNLLYALTLSGIITDSTTA